MSPIARVRRLCIAIAIVLLTRIAVRRRRLRPIGRLWCEEINSQHRRDRYGAYNTIMAESRLSNVACFQRFTRMSPTQFEAIHQRVGPLIHFQDTNYRRAITSGERLGLTLRFLASGESLFSLSLQFRLGVSTACSIVKHTCNALYESHAADYLSPPRTATDWEVIANDFYEKWNFPLCLGALDGKHIRIKCPPKAGSSYYNYKNFHSIVLLALVNAHYQFTVIDVGASGREGDSAIFRTSSLANGMDDGSLRLPNPTTLPNSNQILPYAIVGDEAFPLTPNIMRPYPGRKNGNLPLIKQIFNYRLSRSRRVVENAFGIMANQWRIFHQEIDARPEFVDLYTKVCCMLHNYLIHSQIQDDNDSVEMEEEYSMTTDGVDVFTPLQDASHRNPIPMSDSAILNRDILATYFMNVDPLPWQEALVMDDGYVSP